MAGATIVGCCTKNESKNTLCEDNKGIFGGWFSRNKIVAKEEKKKEESFSLDFNKIAQFPTGSFWDDMAVTAGQKVRGNASSSKKERARLLNVVYETLTLAYIDLDLGAKRHRHRSPHGSVIRIHFRLLLRICNEEGRKSCWSHFW